MSTIDELAAEVRAQLFQDEHFAREACGGTVVGSAYNWRQAPGGDEWEPQEVDDFVMLLVALRPGLGQPSADNAGYWGEVASWRDDGDGERSPIKEFRHAARHDPAAILRRVARDRAMLEQLLAEKHHVADDQYYTCPAATRERDGGTYAETDGGGQCTCRRDERVAGYLALMAQAWQETT